MKTKQAVTLVFREYGNITIPKGTRLTHKTAMGIDKEYHFVDDLSFIERDYKDIASTLRHDATYYGINIPVEFVEFDREDKPVIEVNNMANFEFWVGMFRPRTDAWKRSTLKRLKKSVSPFETAEENADKIKALEFLLN